MKNNISLYNKFLLLMQDIWMEIPLYNLNKNKALRYELEDSFPNSDEKAVAFLKSILSDVINNEDLYIAEVTDGDLHFDNSWLRIIDQSFKCNFIHNFISKNDPDFIEPKQKARVFRFKKDFAELTTLLENIYKLKINSQLFFINLEQKRVMNIYDNRGFDVASPDKDFLKKLFLNHTNYILEYNRNEIIKNLTEY